MKLTKNEKNVVVNAVKSFNEKTGLTVNKDVMVRIISSYDKTDNMSKRLIHYIGGNAVKALRSGKISDVTLLGVEYLNLLDEIGLHTSLGEIRNVSAEGDEGFQGFLDSAFGPKKKLMFKYDKMALKLSDELSKNGVSEDLKTYRDSEMNKKMYETANFIYDVKCGNETSYTSLNLRDDIKAIAPSYMAARKLYEEKNFLGKWFTPSGWFLRGTIHTIEDTLKEANTLLGVRTSIHTEEIPSLLKTSAENETVETGLKDAFYTADNRRVMIEIDDVAKEETDDELKVMPVMDEMNMSYEEDEPSMSYAC